MTIFELGFQAGLGFAAALLLTIAVMLLVGMLVDWITLCLGIGLDSSDAPNKRSGVKVVTDHGTGHEYLAVPRGGITPRLSKVTW